MDKKVLLRVSEDMLKRIDERADQTGYSRNAWLIRALGWALDQPITTRTVEERI